MIFSFLVCEHLFLGPKHLSVFYFFLVSWHSLWVLLNIIIIAKGAQGCCNRTSSICMSDLAGLSNVSFIGTYSKSVNIGI